MEPRAVYSRVADAELRDIGRFIAERDGEQQAKSATDSIVKTITVLAAMPRMGQRKSYLPRGVLAFSARPWMIYDRILPRATGIRVVRIIDGRRNLSELSAKGIKNPDASACFAPAPPPARLSG